MNLKTAFVYGPYLLLVLTFVAFVLKCHRRVRPQAIWTIVLLACFSKFLCYRTFGGDAFAPEMPEHTIWIWNWAYSGACILCALALATYILRIRGRVIWLPLIAWGLSAVGVFNGITPPKVREIALAYPDLPASLDGYRIVQLTDLHVSSAARRWRTQRIVDTANACNGDLIVLTGDLVDGLPPERQIDVMPLRKLKARDGVYAVTGNHEGYFQFDLWKTLYDNWGITFLQNACVFPHADLALGGVDDEKVRAPSVKRAFAAETNGAFRVLLQHRPCHAAQNAREHNVRLQLSGHTHGGIFPGLSYLVKQHNGGFVRGLYTFTTTNTTNLLSYACCPPTTNLLSYACCPPTLTSHTYVSPGAGQWAGFPVRFFNPTEITVITLTRPTSLLSYACCPPTPSTTSSTTPSTSSTPTPTSTPMNTTFIDWSTITPDAINAAMPKLLDDAEKAVAALEASSPATYEDFVWVLNDATRDLWRTWARLSHEMSVMNSDAWRKVQEAWQPKIIAFSLRVSQSTRIYDLAKMLAANEKGTRQRVLQKMVEAAEQSGVGLPDDKHVRFNEIQTRLAKLSTDFHNAVLDATKAFVYEKDGKKYTIDDAEYPLTMKNCADREVRETLCRARAKRAPENAARIDEILKLRRESAALLGYESYAELSVASKSAPSVAAIMKMIDDLDAATAAVANKEASELKDFWRACGNATLAPWDNAYAAERLREKNYSYSEEELKKHFEFADVLAGLFRMTKFLFNVDVEEVTGADKPSVWHPDVRFFRVKENGATIAHFYLDPYVRNGQKSGGAWMNDFAGRRVRNGQLLEKPVAVVVLNLPVPDANGKTYMVWREVETIFHEFGHACQHMLTRVDDEDAAGLNLIEWDAVEIASQFMENWCLDPRTGIQVPEDLKKKVLAAKNFRAATACRRQLAFGKTDMILHGTMAIADADDVKREMFSHFGMPMVAGDRFLCAFTHIFAGGYCAGYYGYKWSEVMSADCYGAFEEAGTSDDAAVKAVGKKYRETILALGGSRSALDVFRLFRGRDPEIAALLRQQGLK